MSSHNPKRKQLLAIIRRQGNYVLKDHSKLVRPVRRPKAENAQFFNKENGKDSYVACQDCLGFFKRNYLRRHRKTCSLRPKIMNSSKRENHLTESQLAMICAGTYKEFYNSLRLKEDVFKMMRNDEISKVAMNDLLICNYAESLLIKHKRSQIKNTISNKMRELGRLLIALRDTTGIQRLVDVLRPEMFNNIVSAVKLISKYDSETRTFKAGSLALHMATTLKQVCNIATKLLIQKSSFLQCSTDSQQALKNIKLTRQLIEDHWNSDVSSLALKDLNEKKWEKPKLLPLTKDIILFENYVTKIAIETCEHIETGLLLSMLKKEYRKLSECVLALTLLLNRKRVGEVQYLKVKTYTKEIPQNHQEEFLLSLTDAEKVLTKNFKRIITGGKGSKPVSILFPKNLQKYLNVMLNVRSKCVPDTNEYLFANPSTPNRWLNGYNVLRKLARESGVKNQELFTSTRLRKQIATVLQVLNITDAEMEQFANFMGHTKKTHETYYRMSEDVYQTAKVSKLLLAISKGKGAHYKGKTLEEIEFSDNLNSEESDSESESEYNQRIQKLVSKKENESLPGTTMAIKKTSNDKTNRSENFEVESFEYNNSDKPSSGVAGDTNVNEMTEDFPDSSETSFPKKKHREKWTQKQKDIVITFFKDHIKYKKAPKKHEVEMFLSKYPGLFKSRNWITIKAFVYNLYRDK
ncbi:uncharacterized protein LOC108916403 [Anoplophora glabripennis]|uniref:uncharacterized protein LOC108916403 n=1 Tax=Anoplophora glabripennis TaxID=217634 RepID=UPI0008736B55|nr:uncharacterized protein LOC108916403 [Anoplophora glabripennis]